MTKNTKNHDAEMMAWAESDAPTIRPGAVIERATPEGRAQVRAMLEAAAESTAEVEALRRLGGRPALDPLTGASPLIAVRVPPTLDQEVRALAADQGRTLSEVTRDALVEYLHAHRRAS